MGFAEIPKPDDSCLSSVRKFLSHYIFKYYLFPILVSPSNIWIRRMLGFILPSLSLNSFSYFWSFISLCFTLNNFLRSIFQFVNFLQLSILSCLTYPLSFLLISIVIFLIFKSSIYLFFKSSNSFWYHLDLFLFLIFLIIVNIFH